MDTLVANDVTASDIDTLKTTATGLAPDSKLRHVLSLMADAMAEGKDVMLSAGPADLSPADAARLLGISRPHVYKLLDRGAIDHHLVGTHKKIKTEDLLTYVNERHQARKDLAETFAHADANRSALIAEMAKAERRS